MKSFFPTIWNFFAPKPLVMLPLRMEISYNTELKTAKIRWYPDDCHLFMTPDEKKAAKSSFEFAMTYGFKLHTFPDKIYLYTIDSQGSISYLTKSNTINIEQLRFKLPQKIKDKNGNKAPDPTVQWLTDFDDAVKNGMGITVAGNTFDTLKDAEWLIALGCRKKSGAVLNDLFNYFKDSNKLKILQQNEPTNNSADDRVSPLVPGITNPNVPAANTSFKTNAQLLNDYLKVKDIFENDVNANLIVNNNINSVQALMQTLCLGAFEPDTSFSKFNLIKLIKNIFAKNKFNKLKDLYYNNLNPGGHMPAVRIGNNPYGFVLTFKKPTFKKIPLYTDYLKELVDLSKMHGRTMHKFQESNYKNEIFYDRFEQILRQRADSKRVDVLVNDKHSSFAKISANTGTIHKDVLVDTLKNIRNILDRNKFNAQTNSYFDSIFTYFNDTIVKKWELPITDSFYIEFFRNLSVVKDKYNQIASLKSDISGICNQLNSNIGTQNDCTELINNLKLKIDAIDSTCKEIAKITYNGTDIQFIYSYLKDYFDTVDISNIRGLTDAMFYGFNTNINAYRTQIKSIISTFDANTQQIIKNSPIIINIIGSEQPPIQPAPIPYTDPVISAMVSKLMDLVKIVDNMKKIGEEINNLNSNSSSSIGNLMKSLADSFAQAQSSDNNSKVAKFLALKLLITPIQNYATKNSAWIDTTDAYMKEIVKFQNFSQYLSKVKAANEYLIHVQVNWDKHIICNLLELSALYTRQAQSIDTSLNARDELEKLVQTNILTMEHFQTKIFELIDAFSHRFDAWYTAYADMLLKKKDSCPLEDRGLGVFGWLEKPISDSKPVQDKNVYFQAPSLDQAKAVAILRAASLSEKSAYQINLSSKRIQQANWYIQGLINGYTSSELLGYYIERQINEDESYNGILKQYLIPLRNLYPIEPAGGNITSNDPMFKRKIIDGENLIKNITQAELANLALSISADIRIACNDKILKIKENARMIKDAFSDLAIAETVYQHVKGNLAKEKAWMEVAEGKLVPLIPEFTSSFRPEKKSVQRVILPISSIAISDTFKNNPRNIIDPAISSYFRKEFSQLTKVTFSLAANSSLPFLDNFPTTINFAELGIDTIDLIFGGKKELETAIKFFIIKGIVGKMAEKDDLIKFLSLLNSMPFYNGIYKPSSNIIDQVERIKHFFTIATPLTKAEFGILPGSLPERIGEQVKHANRLATACANLISLSRTSIKKLKNCDLPTFIDKAAFNDLYQIGSVTILELFNYADFSLQKILDSRNASLTEIENYLKGSINIDNFEKKTIARVSNILSSPQVELLDGTFTNDDKDKILSIALDKLIQKLEIFLKNYGDKNWMMIIPLFESISVKQGTVGNDKLLKQVSRVRKNLQLFFQLPFQDDLAVSSGTLNGLFNNTTGSDVCKVDINYQILNADTTNNIIAGFKVDEWTEYFTSETETSALLVNYDAPQSEPPNCILIAAPNGHQILWNNRKVAKSIRNVIDAMRVRSNTTDEILNSSFRESFPNFNYQFSLDKEEDIMSKGDFKEVKQRDEVTTLSSFEVEYKKNS